MLRSIRAIFKIDVDFPLLGRRVVSHWDHEMEGASLSSPVTVCPDLPTMQFNELLGQ
jgi:hypothetical protein